MTGTDDSANIPHDDARSALRKPVAFQAQLRDRRSTRVKIRVLDLSITGFRAEADYSLHEGDTVWLALPNMAGLEAKIAWVRGNVIGAAFLQPLYPAVFDHIVALSRAG
jgi:hypothetical protein